MTASEAWPHLDDLKRVLTEAPLDLGLILSGKWRPEQEFECQLAKAVHAWIGERKITVQDLYSQTGHGHGLHAVDRAVVSICCLGSSDWPDLGIYRLGEPCTLGTEDCLVAAELKVLQRGKNGSRGGNLWNGIGKASVNALRYPHSLLVVLDLRGEGGTPREEPALRELERRGRFETLIRSR